MGVALEYKYSGLYDLQERSRSDEHSILMPNVEEGCYLTFEVVDDGSHISGCIVGNRYPVRIARDWLIPCS